MSKTSAFDGVHHGRPSTPVSTSSSRHWIIVAISEGGIEDHIAEIVWV